jgi:hypothetical protein
VLKKDKCRVIVDASAGDLVDLATTDDPRYCTAHSLNGQMEEWESYRRLT